MKKLIKKSLTLSLVLVFVLSIIQFNAVTVFADTNSDFTITGGILIEYNGKGGAVTIPSDVTRIGSYAFANRNNITSVTIPDGVKSIEQGVFNNCKNLKSVTIPSSVTSIDTLAFDGTAWVDNYPNDFIIGGDNILIKYKGSQPNVTIPNGVKSIGQDAFYGCTSITSVIIPDGVKSIDGGAFYQCTNLKSAVIPNSVASIEGDAFAYCTNLTDVTIPDSVTSIEDGAFFLCKSLNSITIPNSVKSIGEDAFAGTAWADNYSGDFVTGGDNILIEYKGNQANVTIPDGVKKIAGHAFGGNWNITSVTIPSGVTDIGKNVFYNCKNLTNVSIPSSVTSIGLSAFDGTAWLDNYPNDFVVVGDNILMEYKGSQANVTIPDGVKSIGDYAFYKFEPDLTLKSIAIPNSVTSIGSFAFGNRAGLSSVAIPSSVTSIGDFAFSDCSSLRSLTIPNSVTSIGNYAFQNCTGLASMEIPNSVTNIGAEAFRFCNSLKSVTIPSSVTNIGEGAFIRCNVVTINGETNSYAESYAKANNMPFKSIGVDNVPTGGVIKGNFNTIRLGGTDRYETAVDVSKSGWEQSDNVILTSGETYADALVGTSFAYLKNAPVLITTPDKLNSDVSAEIARLQAKNVYILGSDTTISQNVDNELKEKYNVVRIGGTGLYDTAVSVGNEIMKLKQFDTVIVAPEGDFPDALAIAPFSAMNTMPILFSEKDSLRPDTMTAIQEWGIKNVVIVGGTGVISDTIDSQLKNQGINVTRLAGQDRYDTALEIIKHFEPSQGYKSIAVASGESYPDALTGAGLAAKNSTPLVLVSKDSVKTDVSDYINNHTIDNAYIFGGTGAVSDRVVSK